MRSACEVVTGPSFSPSGKAPPRACLALHLRFTLFGYRGNYFGYAKATCSSRLERPCISLLCFLLSAVSIPFSAYFHGHRCSHVCLLRPHGEQAGLARGHRCRAKGHPLPRHGHATPAPAPTFCMVPTMRRACSRAMPPTWSTCSWRPASSGPPLPATPALAGSLFPALTRGSPRLTITGACSERDWVGCRVQGVRRDANPLPLWTRPHGPVSASGDGLPFYQRCAAALLPWAGGEGMGAGT